MAGKVAEEIKIHIRYIAPRFAEAITTAKPLALQPSIS
jgi:hypothetical protein